MLHQRRDDCEAYVNYRRMITDVAVWAIVFLFGWIAVFWVARLIEAIAHFIA